MNYSKPEITSLAPASSVIQGTKQGGPTDHQQIVDLVTTNAYEADE